MVKVFLDEDELYPVYFIYEEVGLEEVELKQEIYEFLESIHRLWSSQQRILRKKWMFKEWEIEESVELRELVGQVRKLGEMISKVFKIIGRR